MPGGRLPDERRVALNRAACPVDAPKNNIRVEAAEPPPQAIADVERIMQAANIEVGGVEYIVDDCDGQRYYYDINALSNFVADATRVVGFDPFVRLVDFLESARGLADTRTSGRSRCLPERVITTKRTKATKIRQGRNPRIAGEL